jgi:hypothetical protein
VVVESDGVLYDPPVVNGVPPDETEYQLIVAEGFDAVATKLTEPDPHRDPEITPVIVGGVHAATVFNNAGILTDSITVFSLMESLLITISFSQAELFNS